MKLLLLVWLAAIAAHAEHFDIKLIASAPGQPPCEAYADQSPPAAGLNVRPALKARAGDEITFQFIMTNVYPHGSAKGAGVHYYVIRKDAAGERPMIEGRFTFDLKPKARIGAREHFVIGRPGSYLLRVESERTQRDHEHFSAIDLDVR